MALKKQGLKKEKEKKEKKEKGKKEKKSSISALAAEVSISGREAESKEETPDGRSADRQLKSIRGPKKA